MNCSGDTMRCLLSVLPLLIACGAAQQPAAGPTLPDDQRGEDGWDDAESTAGTRGERPSGVLPVDKAKVASSDAPEGATVEEIRAALEVMRGKRMSAVRDAAGEVLSSLADALEVGADGSEQVREAVAEMRFQARRLLRSDITFEGARWAKRALSAALDALEAHTPPVRWEQLEPWVRSAERAVAAIDDDSAITFQRAEVQDGFRTVVDVFALSTEGAGACPTLPYEQRGARVTEPGPQP